MSDSAVLEVRKVSKDFRRGSLLFGAGNVVHAVTDLSLQLRRGDSLGIVGESGCGKSTLARILVGLIPPTGGQVFFEGEDVTIVSRRRRKELYRKIQFVFQDPLSSLNPRKTVRQLLEAPLVHLLGMERERRKERLLELMETVNLRPESLDRYPHEFSGGQNQRIGIARALAAEPSLIVLDEPVSALDVSIQAQILKLLENLSRSLGVTYLFISHDLAVVERMCEQIAVMYLGNLVEFGTRAQIFASPRHPYTSVLMRSVPAPGTRAVTRVAVHGEPPSPSNLPPGCPFEPRCYRAEAKCAEVKPDLLPYPEGHRAACFFGDDPQPPPMEEAAG